MPRRDQGWAGLGAALDTTAPDATAPDTVELKALLATDSTEHLVEGLRRAGWRAGTAVRREVYLADTPLLGLAGRGVGVRARRHGRTVTIVVKVRRTRVDGLPRRSRFPALHIELDALPASNCWTASLTSRTTVGALSSVLRGESPPISLLRRRQRGLLAAAAPLVDLADLRLHGPIHTTRIRLRPRKGPQPAGSRTALGIWEVSQRQFQEVSITCAPEAAVSLAGRTTRALTGSDLDLADVQSLKAPAALALLTELSRSGPGDAHR